MSAVRTLSPFERSPLEIRQQIYEMIEEDRVLPAGSKETNRVFLVQSHHMQEKTIHPRTMLTLSHVCGLFRKDIKALYDQAKLAMISSILHRSLVVFESGVAMRHFAKFNPDYALVIRSVCIADFNRDNPVLSTLLWYEKPQKRGKLKKAIAF